MVCFRVVLLAAVAAVPHAGNGSLRIRLSLVYDHRIPSVVIGSSVRIDREGLTMTDIGFALGTDYESVCVPGPEIQALICIPDLGAAVLACLLICKTAVPLCSLK